MEGLVAKYTVNIIFSPCKHLEDPGQADSAVREFKFRMFWAVSAEVFTGLLLSVTMASRKPSKILSALLEGCSSSTVISAMPIRMNTSAKSDVPGGNSSVCIASYRRAHLSGAYLR